MKVSLARTSLVNEPGKCGKTIAVVYELTKRTQEKLFADWAQQYKAFFVPNQVQVSASIFGNSSVRVENPGALSPVLENFRRALSPDPTDCPWVSEDGNNRARLY